MTKEKLLRTRKRLLEDFQFWSEHSCKIRTKAGEVVPFKLNKVQLRYVKHLNDQLLTTGNIRSIVLKGRQQGMSTFIHAYIYWHLSQHSGKKGVVIAHDADGTRALFDMYKRTHDNMPEMLKPETKYSSKRELAFKALDTSVVVRTAGGDAIGRSETFQAMHLSEVGFWPKAYAADNFNAVMKTLPNVAGTMCFIESTANGVTGEYHDTWIGAVAGTNEFVPFFSAWFDSDEYRTTPPEGFTRAPDEEELVEKYGLDDAQLYWRRREIAKNGLDLFKQEYPCTASEAFLTTGRPVFDQMRVQEWLDNAPEPIARMAVDLMANDKGELEYKVFDDPRGELLVYRKREPNGTYYIGADVSVGIKDKEKSDYCVAQVLDSQKRQVAVWRGQVTPDHYAHVLNTLGYYYNIAMIAPERNGHGLLVAVRLWKDLNYPNCFTDLKEGEIADRETLNIGFQTNVSSKPLIIDKLRGEVRNSEITLYDKTTLQEMLTFIVTDSGKMEGDANCYDDTVMALAIANHIHEGKWEPVTVTDEFYVNAI
jgi:hypothetical protein